MNTILNKRIKKLFFAFIAIFNTALAISQTEYEYKRAKVRPLNQTEIKNSYVFRNDENKYKTSSLVKFTSVTNFDITKDFLNDISTLLDTVNSLKNKVNDSNDIELLNKNIFLLKKLQYNMTSTDGIVCYDAIMKHINYSNIETIDTITVIVKIDQFLNGKYQPNRLVWLWSEHDKERLIKSVHSEEREKFSDIFQSVKRIQEKQNQIIEREKDENQEEKIYDSSYMEQKPEFPGGMIEFYKFIAKNYLVPDEEGLNGTVYVAFTVEKDGTLTDLKVIRDIGYATGKEALRVLRISPPWYPGEQDGKEVRCTYSLPISIGGSDRH